MEGVGNFQLVAPRGGPFSLRQRCLWALTYDFVVKIEEIVSKHTWLSPEAIIEDFRKIIVSKLLQLPIETTQIFINKYLLAAGSDAARFATALAISTLDETKSLDIDLRFVVSSMDPIYVCRKFVPSFGSCITNLIAPRTAFDDDFLMSLAGTSVSKTLQKLDIASTYVTDASVAAWKHFVALEELAMSFCNYITATSALEIALLPKLRVLELWNPLTRMSINLPEFLDPPRLPCIQNLWISPLETHPSEADLQLVLQSLAAHTTLTSLMISFEKYPDGVHADIMKCLPNLTALPQPLKCDFEEFRKIARFSPSLEMINCGPKDVGIANQEHLDELASIFPQLTELNFTGTSSEQSLDFAKFSSLRSLSVTTPMMRQIVGLPNYGQLRAFAAFEPIRGNENAASLDDPMESIVHVTSLTDLRIQCFASSITPKHVATITSRLTNLSTLYIQNFAKAPPNTGSITLSASPFMANMHIDNVKALLDQGSAYLPSVTTLSRCGLKFDSVTPDRLPNLARVSTSGISNDDDEVSTASFLQLFAKQLRELVVSSSKMQRLPNLSRLSILKIRPEIPERNAAELFSRMPNLMELELTVDSERPAENFAWIKHNNLRRLRLSYPRKFVDPSRKRPDLVLSAENLPRVRSIYLSIPSLPVDYVSITSLDELVEFELKLYMGQKIGISVEKCPFLTNATFDGAVFTSFQMKDVKFLFNLTINGCNTESKKVKKVVEGCPHLVIVKQWNDSRTTINKIPLSKWLSE